MCLIGSYASGSSKALEDLGKAIDKAFKAEYERKDNLDLDCRDEKAAMLEVRSTYRHTPVMGSRIVFGNCIYRLRL